VRTSARGRGDAGRINGANLCRTRKPPRATGQPLDRPASSTEATPGGTEATAGASQREQVDGYREVQDQPHDAGRRDGAPKNGRLMARAIAVCGTAAAKFAVSPLAGTPLPAFRSGPLDCGPTVPRPTREWGAPGTPLARGVAPALWRGSHEDCEQCRSARRAVDKNRISWHNYSVIARSSTVGRRSYLYKEVVPMDSSSPKRCAVALPPLSA
jgi:hypothetical protein